MSVFFYYVLLVNSFTMIVICQSPCPGFFRYAYDDKTGEIFGRIAIPHLPINVPIQIRVNLSIATILPTPYVGKIELVKSKVESVKAIGDGEPLQYNLFFPVQRPVPLLTEIMVNDYQYCRGPKAYAPFITNYFLEHRLNPRGSSPPNATHEATSPATPPPPNVDVSKGDFAVTPPADSLFHSTPLNSHQDENCGKPSRVNHSMPNDAKAIRGQWPWLAAIFVARYNLQFHCSGTLITDRHILTAAHCMILNSRKIPANLLIISLGRYRLDDWHEAGAVNLPVQTFVVHPEYTNGGSAHADLAIVILRERVQMNWQIKPVCLWNGIIALEPIVGKVGYVGGWGEDQNGHLQLEGPRLARVFIISQEDCLRSNLQFVQSGSSTSNKTLCAGHSSGACNEDSGSGLVIYDQTSDRYYLRGVLSFSLPDQNMNCHSSFYVVYADIAKFRNWIHTHIS